MGCTESTLCPPPPLTPRQKLRAVALGMSATARRNGSVNRRLFWLIEFNAAPNPNPVRGVRTADFIVDPSRGLWFRLFLPSAPPSGALPVVVFFHGGGFAFLSAATREFDSFCRRLCRTLPAFVVSVDYRLSPEHRFPAQYEDGLDVLRFLDTAAAAAPAPPLLREFLLAADLSLCFLAGDSAGANIAHNVARRWAEEADPKRVRLAGLVALQPFFGGESRAPSQARLGKGTIVAEARTDWMWRAFLPEGAERDHSAANPVASAKGLSPGFPPAMIAAGDLDPLLDWQRLYYESLVKNGRQAEFILYPGAFHCSYLFPKLKGGSYETIADVRHFVNRQIVRRRQDDVAGLPGHDEKDLNVSR